MMTDVNVALV